MYQNRFGIMEVQKDGCLFCTLGEIAEQETGVKLTHDKWVEIYYSLNAKRVLSYDLNNMSFGAFVHDHQEVLNEFLKACGSTKRARYIMRQYVKPEFGTSFGTENYKDCNYIILQVQTPNGGHFRMLDYDPYEYGTKTLYVKSIRGYLIE